MIDKVLSGGAFKDKRKVSIFLDFMENILKIVAPIIKSPGTKRSSTHTGKYKLTHSEVFSLCFLSHKDVDNSAIALCSLTKRFTFFLLLKSATALREKQCILVKSWSLYLGPELQLLVRRGVDLPQGPVTLSSKHVKLDIKLETAAGELSSYPGNNHTCNKHIHNHFQM